MSQKMVVIPKISVIAELSELIGHYLVECWPEIEYYIPMSIDLALELNNDTLFLQEYKKEPKNGISIEFIPLSDNKIQKHDGLNPNQYSIISACAIAALRTMEISDIGYYGSVFFNNQIIRISFCYGASKWLTKEVDRLIVYNEDWRKLIDKLSSG